MDRETEIDLVRRLKTGDSAAFDIVYETFNSRLFTFLVRLARNRERAEDLLEETWLRLVTHADRLQPDTRLGPWLFTVARNLYVSHYRSRLLEESYADYTIGLFPLPRIVSPFEETAASELERRVEAALASLSPADREVLLLVAVEGLELAEAASVCGITDAALRQRLKRARDRLARCLDQSTSAAQLKLREVFS